MTAMTLTRSVVIIGLAAAVFVVQFLCVSGTFSQLTDFLLRKQEFPYFEGFAREYEIPYNEEFAREQEIPFNEEFARKQEIPYNEFAREQEIPYNEEFARKQEIPYNEGFARKQEIPYNEFARKQEIPYNEEFAETVYQSDLSLPLSRSMFSTTLPSPVLDALMVAIKMISGRTEDIADVFMNALEYDNEKCKALIRIAAMFVLNEMGVSNLQSMKNMNTRDILSLLQKSKVLANSSIPPKLKAALVSASLLRVSDNQNCYRYFSETEIRKNKEPILRLAVMYLAKEMKMSNINHLKNMRTKEIMYDLKQRIHNIDMTSYDDPYLFRVDEDFYSNQF